MEILVLKFLHLAGLKETLPKDLRVYIAEEISKVRHFTPQNYQRDWTKDKTPKDRFQGKERHNPCGDFQRDHNETPISPLFRKIVFSSSANCVGSCGT